MFNSEGRGEVDLIHSSYLMQLCFAQHGAYATPIFALDLVEIIFAYS